MILLIDNYDSFTFNLYQYLGELGEDVRVFRNDQISLKEIEKLNPKQLMISPGPGRPSTAGICLELVQHFAGEKPILGICLGYLSLGEAFGAKVIHAPELYHGKTSPFKHNEKGIYQGIPQDTPAARYHSLVLEKASLPACFKITAWTDSGLIMGIKHKELSIEGIQFHPESIMTLEGKNILRNFLKQTL